MRDRAYLEDMRGRWPDDTERGPVLLRVGYLAPGPGLLPALLLPSEPARLAHRTVSNTFLYVGLSHNHQTTLKLSYSNIVNI